MRQPRDYQAECVAKVQRSLAANASSIVVMATGLGKSYCFARFAQEWGRGNVLVLAHRIELVDQAAETICRELGYMPFIEQAERGCDPDYLHQGGQIIVGSIQTMISPKRVRKYRRHPFGLIVIDECHRATAPSYQKLLDYYRGLNPELRVLGVTATANRTDGTALGIVFEDVAFEMGIIAGIDEGWLVDIHQKFAVLGQVDFSQLRMTRNQFGEMDFNAEDLERVMVEEESLHEMTRPVLDTTEDGKQAIIFTASVAHAHVWAMVLNRYRPGCAAAVDGETDKDKRGDLVRQYKAGDLQFLLNFGVFTEGFDAPSTSMVVMGRPTKSILTYSQQLGRGTRTIPGLVDNIPTAEGRRDAIAASAKPWLTVLDFVGNSRHKIMSAVDVLGGNYDVDDGAIANEAAKGRLKNGAGNVRDAIRKARAAMILLAEEKKRQGVKFSHVAYQLQDVDPFGGAAVPQTPATGGRGGATDGQVAFLVNLGVDRDTALAYGRKQAGAVITAMKAKRCTDRQAGILRKYGIDPAGHNVESASAAIDEIKANGWRAP